MNNTALFAYYYSQPQSAVTTLPSAPSRLPRRDQILLEKCRAFRARRAMPQTVALQPNRAESTATA
jgi:hypothetical protein